MIDLETCKKLAMECGFLSDGRTAEIIGPRAMKKRLHLFAIAVIREMMTEKIEPMSKSEVKRLCVQAPMDMAEKFIALQESKRQHDEWLSNGIYFTEAEYKTEVEKIADLQAKITEQEKEIDALVRAVADHVTVRTEQAAEIAQKNADISDWTQRYAEKCNDLAAANKEIEALRKDAERIEFLIGYIKKHDISIVERECVYWMYDGSPAGIRALGVREVIDAAMKEKKHD